MTTSTVHGIPGDDDQEHGEHVAEYESVHVRERLVKRTCAWCGTELRYSGRGRPPKFCTDNHRKRWHEREKAKAELGDAPTPEPVREVIERTETVVRTVVRKGPTVLQPVVARPEPGQMNLRFPETFEDWHTMLALLQVDASKLRGHHRARELQEVLVQLVTDDFPGTVDVAASIAAPRTVEDWYGALRQLLTDVRSDRFTQAQRADLARVFGIAVEHLLADPGGPNPVAEEASELPRAERRRREREARKRHR
jgi:hypothetical protein